jgi:hypothetical protein
VAEEACGGMLDGSAVARRSARDSGAPPSAPGGHAPEIGPAGPRSAARDGGRGEAHRLGVDRLLNALVTARARHRLGAASARGATQWPSRGWPAPPAALQGERHGAALSGLRGDPGRPPPPGCSSGSAHRRRRARGGRWSRAATASLRTLNRVPNSPAQGWCRPRRPGSVGIGEMASGTARFPTLLPPWFRRSRERRRDRCVLLHEGLEASGVKRAHNRARDVGTTDFVSTIATKLRAANLTLIPASARHVRAELRCGTPRDRGSRWWPLGPPTETRIRSPARPSGSSR